MDPVNNRLMILALAVGFSLQFVVTEQTSLVAAFQTVRLTKTEWARLIILSAMPLFAHELLLLLSHFGRVNGQGRRSIGEKSGDGNEHRRGTEAG